MNIDDLKAQAEDVEPVVEAQPNELTEEQKEKLNKMFRSRILIRYKPALKLLYDRMKKKHLSVMQIKQQIIDKDKTIPFSASQREFIMDFKDEFIVSLLKDLYTEKELHEIDLTISEPVSTETGDTGDVSGNS